MKIKPSPMKDWRQLNSKLTFDQTKIDFIVKSNGTDSIDRWFKKKQKKQTCWTTKSTLEDEKKICFDKTNLF